jgi:hypothetical protein
MFVTGSHGMKMEEQEQQAREEEERMMRHKEEEGRKIEGEEGWDGNGEPCAWRHWGGTYT